MMSRGAVGSLPLKAHGPASRAAVFPLFRGPNSWTGFSASTGM